MKRKYFRLLFLVLVIFLQACGASGDGANSPAQIEATPVPTLAGGFSHGGKVGNDASLFPFPTNVYNYMVLNQDTLSFNTSLTFDKVIEFYSEQFGNAGYAIRESATEINDTNFTMVWDGHESGRGLVVQGLNLENGSYNIIVRFEGAAE